MMQSLFKPPPVPLADPVAREIPASKTRRWVGGIMAALAVVFLFFDSIIKMRGLGLALPRTSVLGAILMTGFLGGAVAAHVRAGSPLLTQTLLPVFVAVLTWGGLLLRDGHLRPLVGHRR